MKTCSISTTRWDGSRRPRRWERAGASRLVTMGSGTSRRRVTILVAQRAVVADPGELVECVVAARFVDRVVAKLRHLPRHAVLHTGNQRI